MNEAALKMTPGADAAHEGVARPEAAARFFLRPGLAGVDRATGNGDGRELAAAVDEGQAAVQEQQPHEFAFPQEAGGDADAAVEANTDVFFCLPFHVVSLLAVF